MLWNNLPLDLRQSATSRFSIIFTQNYSVIISYVFLLPLFLGWNVLGMNDLILSLLLYMYLISACVQTSPVNDATSLCKASVSLSKFD